MDKIEFKKEHTIKGVTGVLEFVQKQGKPIEKQVFYATRYNKRDAGVICIRWDDQCSNGHESFSMTMSINYADGGSSSGQSTEEMQRFFPELSPFHKWHLMGAQGPMHYIGNTTYHAGDRDFNGLRAGEKKQIVNGKTGEPAWRLAILDANGEEVEPRKQVDGRLQPILKDYTVAYVPCCRTGEGKKRDLDAARDTAIWPEATDEQLMLPKEELTKLLEQRLPALVNEWQRIVETELGFTF